ncbi:MAG TPA: hypothetical protein VFH36_10090 [Acidimicrobiales bacterium]|nr:hypothetical protein [Acidimicrobiales bacterium]
MRPDDRPAPGQRPAQGSDLYGDSGNDHVVGGAGIDILEDGNGADYVSGNGGPDVLRSTGNSGTLGPDVFSGGAGNDGLYSVDDSFDESGEIFENWTSGPKEPYGDDMLLGANTPDELYGGAGNDTLACCGGVDLADGGSGQDALRRPAPPPACETMMSIP